MKVLVDLTDVDWYLLREQKRQLVEMAHWLQQPEALAADGIIHLLDHIQDAAALQIGEAAVFGDQPINKSS